MSTGEEIRLARLFDGGGNAVVAAIDHGLYNGPRPGFEDLPAIVDRLAGADAILISPGTAGHVASVFRPSRRAGDDGPPELGHPVRDPVGLPREPQRPDDLAPPRRSPWGPTSSSSGMSIKTGSEAVDAENVEMVARCVAEKRVAGVPIVGEVYPAGHEDISPEERHEVISIGCRIVAELGVDLVKTFYTGERFAEIVRSTPVPILALGAKKLRPRARRAGPRGQRRPGRCPGRRLRPQPHPGARHRSLPAGAARRRQERARPGRGGHEVRDRLAPPESWRRSCGLDIGTTAVKAGLFADDGRLLAARRRGVPAPHPGAGPHRARRRALLDGARSRRSVGPWRRPGSTVRPSAAIAVSSQGETVVPVDGDGRPVGPAIVWLDNRAGAEARALEDRFGTDRVYDVTGVPSVVADLDRLQAPLVAASTTLTCSPDATASCSSRTSSSTGSPGASSPTAAIQCTTMLFDIVRRDAGGRRCSRRWASTSGGWPSRSSRGRVVGTLTAEAARRPSGSAPGRWSWPAGWTRPPARSGSATPVPGSSPRAPAAR